MSPAAPSHWSFPEEKQFFEILDDLSISIAVEYPAWGRELEPISQRASALFQSNSPLSQRYQLAREAESLFGGMGSLNDGPFSDANERLIKRFYSSVNNLLRVYWRALGNEYHEKKFEKIPVGSIVRLVPEHKLMIGRDEKPVFPTNADLENNEWVILRDEEPDITNMPTYLIKNKHERYRFVRLDSFEVTEKQMPLKQLFESNAPTPAGKPSRWVNFIVIILGILVAKFWIDFFIGDPLKTKEKTIPTIKLPAH